MAAYFTVWIILSGTWEFDWFNTQANRIKWFVYWTHWSFFVLVLMLLVQAAVVLFDFYKKSIASHNCGENFVCITYS